MNSSVDRILEGKFNTGNHSMSFSVPMLEFKVCENDIYEGSFFVYGPDDTFIESEVSVTGLRMKCLVNSFTGNNIEVPFSFDASGLIEGDIYKGEFRVISNQGEYMLPYEVKIEAKNISTELGDIKNLFHFTNLAKTDWNEAVRLFSSKNFINVLGGSEKQYISVYNSLKNSENIDQSVEEFLLYVKKKQPAEFIIENPNIKIENSVNEFIRYIEIVKNGWGYIKLNVSTNCEFIQLDKDVILEGDFDSNTLRLPYSIKESKLHEGRNFGTVILSNAYNNIKINICVIVNSFNKKSNNINKLSKQYIVDLVKYYESYRLRKISTNTWVSYTTEIIDKLSSIEPENIAYELMNIHMLITGERYNEASWRLEQLDRNSSQVLKNDKVIYCYYYYLTTLINRTSEHINDVTSMIERIYDNNISEWRIGWLLLYLSEDAARMPSYRWEKLQKMFLNGSNSPVIYVEACQILTSNPTIMTSLGEFEIQILKYMSRNDALTEGIIDQFIYLLGLSKNYNKSLYILLTKCYEKMPSDDVLKAIVSLLINTDQTDEKAFIWYEKAVEHSLRITRLYEYYMMSIKMDLNVEIPKIVLMYFAFDSNLEPMKNAFLYSYVYQKKDEFPDLYNNYKEAIERFVSFQLLKGANNKYLTYLYRSMISEKMITNDVAKGLLKALFTCVIKPIREGINKIIIYYDYMDREFIYKLNEDNVSYIPLYGTDFKIILEDMESNRYVREEEYEIVKLMVPDKLAGYLVSVVDDILFDLWYCIKNYEINKITVDNLKNMQRIEKNQHVDIEIRKKLRFELLGYYYNNDMMDELDALLNSLEYSDVNIQNVTAIIQYFTQRGLYKKAYEWIVQSAGEKIDAKTIVKIISRILKEGEYADINKEDPILLSFIYKAFRSGKYDETLLRYLIKYIHCTTRELKEIYKAVKDYGMDVTSLEERMLNQQLYTNAYVSGMAEIFADFSKKRKDNRLCMAYISQMCFEYFVNEKVIDDIYIRELQSYIDEDEEIPLVCKLAYTRFYSKDAETLSEKVSRSVLVYLKEIMVKGMYFAYFKDYARTITFMHRFIDKTMIEYRMIPGHKATIHFMIEKSADTKNEYITEDIKDMFYGIGVMQFVLFFGERIQYYVVENDGENEQLTESGTLSSNEMEDRENVSRYTMINDIAIARTLGDYGTMDNLLNEYFMNEYLLDEMFTIAE